MSGRRVFIRARTTKVGHGLPMVGDEVDLKGNTERNHQRRRECEPHGPSGGEGLRQSRQNTQARKGRYTNHWAVQPSVVAKNRTTGCELSGPIFSLQLSLEIGAYVSHKSHLALRALRICPRLGSRPARFESDATATI